MEKAHEDKEIILKLDIKQVAVLGSIFNQALQTHGMTFLEPIYEMQQQIKKQLPETAIKKIPHTEDLASKA